LDESAFLINVLKGTQTAGSGFASASYAVAIDNGTSDTNTWANSATSKGLSGHTPTPTFIDIRNTEKNRGKRYNLASEATGESSPDLVMVFEDGQEVDYPTLDWGIRNETYNMTIHIRSLHDRQRQGAETKNFGQRRLESLYKIVRHRLEQNRTGCTITLTPDGKTASETLRADQIIIGPRSEANDRNKFIFGYRINVTLKKFAVSL